MEDRQNIELIARSVLVQFDIGLLDIQHVAHGILLPVLFAGIQLALLQVLLHVLLHRACHVIHRALSIPQLDGAHQATLNRVLQLFLLLGILAAFNLHQTMQFTQLSRQLFRRQRLTVVPLVLLDATNRDPLTEVIPQHASNQIFRWSRNTTSTMLLPKLARISIRQWRIPSTFRGSRFERRISRQQNEEYDTATEHIARRRIFLLFQNLGRLIATRAHIKSAHQRIFIFFKHFRQSEICNLELEIRVQQQILRFNVAMTNARLMTRLHAIHELLEVRACDALVECRCVVQDVKQFAAWQILEHEQHRRDDEAILLRILRVQIVRQQLQHMLVFNLSQRLNLVLNLFRLRRTPVAFGFRGKLERHHATIFAVVTLLDPRVTAFAQCLAQKPATNFAMLLHGTPIVLAFMHILLLLVLLLLSIGVRLLRFVRWLWLWLLLCLLRRLLIEIGHCDLQLIRVLKI
mmetsp:Transcript_53188/g.88171  ORF Transcript_53188/g.88171 Transcript_53188/m.88171 type:complete len:462 (-) Transcript_53188:115-1500(-)